MIQRLILPFLLTVTGLPAADDSFQLHQDVSYLGPDRAEKMDIYLPRGGSGRIAVGGGSAGGHLAMLMAYTPAVGELNQGALYPDYPVNVSCVINLYGIADVRLWGKQHFIPRSRIDTDEGRRTLELVSPIVQVNATTVPTLVIHGTNDPTVPFSQAENWIQRLKECGVPHQFIRVEHGEHAFPFTPHVRNQHRNLMPVVAAFLQEHLKK